METQILRSPQPVWEFDPTVIPNCTLWIDANDPGSVNTPGAVSTITDKSKTGTTVTVNSNGWSTTNTSTPFRGKNVIQTVSSGGTLSFNTSNFSISSNITFPLTLFIVGAFQNINATPSKTLFDCSNGYSIVGGTGGTPTITGTVGGSSTGAAMNPSTFTSGSPFVYTADILVTSGSQNLFSNGGNLVGRATLAKTSFGTSLVFGNGVTATNTQWQGQIAEILMYNRKMTNIELRQIEGYLAWKWGFPNLLSSNNFRTPFYNNIFGPAGPFTTNIAPYLRPFVPTDIAGCYIWLDGADRNTITGAAPITIWSDKANGIQFAPAAGSTGPTLTAVTTNPQGTDITFSSTSYLNLQASIGTISFPAITVFVVYKQTSTATSGAGSAGRILSAIATGSTESVDTTGVGFRIYKSSSLASTTVAERNALGNSMSALNNSNLTIGRFTFAKTGSNSTIVCNYSNSSSIASTATVNLSFSTLSIGSMTTASNTTFLDGVVNEVIIYDSALSAPDIARVEGYLGWKWTPTTTYGAGLPQTLPYSKFPTASVTPFDPRVIGLINSTTPGNGNLIGWYDASDPLTATSSSLSNSAWTGTTPSFSFAGFSQPTLNTGSANGLSSYVFSSANPAVRTSSALSIAANSFVNIFASMLQTSAFTSVATQGAYDFITSAGVNNTSGPTGGTGLINNTWTIRTNPVGQVFLPDTLTITFGSQTDQLNFGLVTNSQFFAVVSATTVSGYGPNTTAPYTTTGISTSAPWTITATSLTVNKAGSGTNLIIANAWEFIAGTAGVTECLTLKYYTNASVDNFNMNVGDTFTLTYGGYTFSGSAPAANTIYTVSSISPTSQPTIKARASVNTTAARGTLPSVSPAFRMTCNPISSTNGSYTFSGAAITSTGITGQSTTLPNVFFAKFSRTSLSAGLNGVVGTSSSAIFPADSYSFGNLRVFSGSSCRGNINEILVFNSTTDMTTQQRQQVEAYLAWKWGGQTLLPKTHPYYNLRP